MTKTESKSRTLPRNHKAVMAAKTAKGRAQTEYRIKGEKGLTLLVGETGAATFSLTYYKPKGRGRYAKRRIRIGTRGDMELAEACTRAATYRLEVDRGHDPAFDRRLEREAITFRQLVARRFAEDDKLGPATRAGHAEHFARDVYAAIGDKPADAVTAAEVVRIIDKVEARGAVVSADRVKEAIQAAYSWGLKRLIVKNNPAANLGNRSSDEARDRVLSNDELRRVVRAIKDDDEITEAMRLLLQLRVYLPARSGELIKVKLGDLRLGDQEPIWTISGAKLVKGRTVRGDAKNKRTQVVPLVPQVVTLFKKAIELSGAKNAADYLFPARRQYVKPNPKHPLSPHVDRHSLARAVKRVMARANAVAEEEDGEIDAVEDFRPYDLRRTCSTWLGDRSDVADSDIDNLLNHKPQGVTKRVYNHAKRLPQVRAAATLWANHVDAL